MGPSDMTIKYILNPKSSFGMTQDLISLLIAASSSLLLLYTLNFTITNLPYTKDMEVPGSSKFYKVEKALQLLVRLLPTSLASPTLSPLALLALSSDTWHLIAPLTH